jgi:plastocyanin
MRRYAFVALALAAGAAACGGGGDDGGGPGGDNPFLAKQSGDNQTGTVNTQLANEFCVKVTESGAAVEGSDVNWTTSSGGTLLPTSIPTNVDGVACSRLTLGTAAGAQATQATVSGATGSPITFNATANPGNATNLVKVDGDNQTGDLNAPLSEPLTARVNDIFGNGVQGALVTWLVGSGDATVGPTSGNTNANGVATTTVTVGSVGGAIQITASSAGLVGSPQTFNATGTAPPPAPNAITITVQNNSFTPRVDTVAVGGTVTWNWAITAGIQHSVTTTGPTSFTSDPAGAIASPHSYGPIIFAVAGTYHYYCTVHGNPGNPPTAMSGTIVVR